MSITYAGRKRLGRPLSSFVGLIMLIAGLSAGSAVRASNATAIVPADEANREAHIVNKGIVWQTSLEQAQAEARKQGKLVFWMHMLGTIDGAT
jgi:hypothetical protein